MRVVPFKQVDVFTRVALGGNPVAVVLDAEGLSQVQMQRIAAWTNLSETAFVLPVTQADASYRVRIFTPKSELPFAGHPSVGTAHALLEAHLVTPQQGRLVQQCEAGLLPLSVNGEGAERRVSVRAPQARLLPTADVIVPLLDAALEGLPRGSLAPRFYDNGPHWWLVEVQNEQAVRQHRPNLEAIAALTVKTGATGLALMAEVQGEDYQRVVRGFCPADGIPEDPVTGSANASIGAMLLAHSRARIGDDYIASQGREVGRDGRVEVRLREDGVWIGGTSVTVIDGMIRLD